MYKEEGGTEEGYGSGYKKKTNQNYRTNTL